MNSATTDFLKIQLSWKGIWHLLVSLYFILTYLLFHLTSPDLTFFLHNYIFFTPPPLFSLCTSFLVHLRVKSWLFSTPTFFFLPCFVTSWMMWIVDICDLLTCDLSCARWVTSTRSYLWIKRLALDDKSFPLWRGWSGLLYSCHFFECHRGT